MMKKRSFSYLCNKYLLQKSLFLYKRISLTSLILYSLAAGLVSPALPVNAATYEEVLSDIEERKNIPIESNEIENWPDGPVVSAQAAIVMEANTGIILYSKNIHEPLFPASTTKILTCLIAAEHCDMDEMVTFSHEAVFSIERGSSNMGMDVGQALTMEEALYGILVGSANEVANAVAEHVGGSIEGFAEMMNEKAAALGCTNSHFTNPSGLHNEEHYTSAHDLATIAQAFYKNELLAKMSNTPSRHFQPTETQPDDFVLRPHHKIVTGEYPYEGIVGGKTGYTTDSRQTLVTCAERNGMKLICVVLREESPDQFLDTISLLDYGFQNFEAVNISEHETRYQIDQKDFFHSSNDIFGNSRSILTLDTESCLILPKTASFEDVSSSISYDAAQEGEIAKIDYTYQDIYIGSASVCLDENAVSDYEFTRTEEAMESDPDDPGKVQGSGSPTSGGTSGQEAVSDSRLIFIDIRQVLFIILLAAGVLILLFGIRSVLKNYSFGTKTKNRKKSRSQFSLRKKHPRREIPKYRTKGEITSFYSLSQADALMQSKASDGYGTQDTGDDIP